MSSEAGHIGIVARQAVCTMVGCHVEVSVNADRAILAGSTGGAGVNRPAGTLVFVAMTGPDGAPHRGNVRVSDKAEASAWGIDEIVSAARRAAERILAKNPTWRRASGAPTSPVSAATPKGLRGA
jgi:hypothetical protein